MPNRQLKSVVRQRPLVVASPETSVLDAARAMRDKGVGSVLIEAHQTLVGIFTERDLMNRVVAAGLSVADTTLAQVMTAEVIGLEGDKPLSHALQSNRTSMALGTYPLEQGRPVGIVSARDALGIEWQQFERELKLADDIAEILA